MKRKGSEMKTDDMGRQVWDKTVYLQKAAARAMGVEEEVEDKKGKKRKLLAGETPTEYLRQRNKELNPERRIGERKTIDTTVETRSGFACEVCNCVLTDSQSYLDHVNGIKHNRLLGMTMRVQKADRESVLLHLQKAKARSEQSSARLKTKPEEVSEPEDSNTVKSEAPDQPEVRSSDKPEVLER